LYLFDVIKELARLSIHWYSSSSLISQWRTQFQLIILKCRCQISTYRIAPEKRNNTIVSETGHENRLVPIFQRLLANRTKTSLHIRRSISLTRDDEKELVYICLECSATNDIIARCSACAA